jgi:hypothetical protein
MAARGAGAAAEQTADHRVHRRGLHRHLRLMVLSEDKAAQFRPEMAGDAGWQWRCHDLAARCLPTLTVEIHDVRVEAAKLATDAFGSDRATDQLRLKAKRSWIRQAALADRMPSARRANRPKGVMKTLKETAAGNKEVTPW